MPERDPSEIKVVTTATVDGIPHITIAPVFAYFTNYRFASTFDKALRELREEALKLGADAVVGLQHATTFVDEQTNSRCTITLLGTAVRLPWPEGSADPIIFDNPPAE